MGEHFQQRPCERRTKRKSAAFAQFPQGKILPQQPEIAPQFCRREILVGIPLPTPSKTCLRPVGSLRSQHGFAMKGTTRMDGKLACKGKPDERRGYGRCGRDGTKSDATLENQPVRQETRRLQVIHSADIIRICQLL